MDDPYIWMENLKDLRVLEFIRRHNERFKNLVKRISEEYIKKIKKYYNVPTVMDIAPSDKGIYFIICEGMSYKIKLLTPNNEVYEIISSDELGENVLIRSVTSREDGKRIAFFYTFAGSDEGYVRIINPFTHETIDELKGSVWNITWVKGDK
ncbi:MAG: S9 family peptidase [Staphylothermus sp.]|nr:S9 family peptidase [Staphylothermus sp.]